MSLGRPLSIDIPVDVQPGIQNVSVQPLLSPSHTSPLPSPSQSRSESPSCLFDNMPVSPSEEYNSSKSTSQTFVHKLFDMVEDTSCQSLITWNYNGTSFIVCNVVEFAKDVLPQHFKHSNFSSFVRQLNMYGFHKINKTSRGQRGVVENQIWEFCHPKFMRGRTDLLDDIKRKPVDSELLRREAGDMYGQISTLQVAQADIFQQLNQLQMCVNSLTTELEESKRVQQQQAMFIKGLVNSLTEQGITVSGNFFGSTSSQNDNPTVYITTADARLYNNSNIPQFVGTSNTVKRESPSINIAHFKNTPQTTSMPLSPNSNTFRMACSIPLPPSPMPMSPLMEAADPFSIPLVDDTMNLF